MESFFNAIQSDLGSKDTFVKRKGEKKNIVTRSNAEAETGEAENDGEKRKKEGLPSVMPWSRKEKSGDAW